MLSMPGPVRAFLFDMDGLLLDSEWLHIRAYMELTRRLGCPQDAAALKRFIGHSNHVTCAWLVEELRCPGTREELMAREYELYMEILERERPEPFEGVRELFELADRRGMQRALVSSSAREIVDPTMRMLAAHLRSGGYIPVPQAPAVQSWREHFHSVCTGDRVERLKPAPDLYLLAARELGLAPGECVAFEDSPAGVSSAYAAGCRVVAVPNLYLPHLDVAQGKAAHVFATLAEAHRQIERVLTP